MRGCFLWAPGALPKSHTSGLLQKQAPSQWSILAKARKGNLTTEPEVLLFQHKRLRIRVYIALREALKPLNLKP